MYAVGARRALGDAARAGKFRPRVPRLAPVRWREARQSGWIAGMFTPTILSNLHGPLLAVHIMAGLLASAIGVAPILTRKGTRAHRIAGRAFVIAMLVLLAAAWSMTAIRLSSYFLALSASATLTLFSGYRVLGRKRPDLRPMDRGRSIDWFVTLAILGVGGWTSWLVLSGAAGARAGVSGALAGGALAIGSWDLWRFARPRDWPFSPNLWMYEHLVKMLGAYGAVLSALAGNYMQFLPKPWSQLWPTLLLQPLAVIWVIVLLVRNTSRRRRT